MEQAQAEPQHQSKGMYRAVFFDLDGTLLPMEIEEFLVVYFKAIGAFVAKHGLDPQAFTKALQAGTKAMMKHDGTITNAEAYWNTFYELIGESEIDWQKLLMEFYNQEFAAIGKDVQANPAVKQALDILEAKGYTLLLTTMPMFPPEAVCHRLAWAGVDAHYFKRLTSYDNSTSTKPKLDYYAENLAACGLSGEDVLMVGNNTVEDLAAMQLGCDAFLVTDHLLDPTGNFDLSTVKHGSMAEFAAWAESLPECEAPATSVDAGVIGYETKMKTLGANRVAQAEEHNLEDSKDFYQGKAPELGAFLGKDKE